MAEIILQCMRSFSLRSRELIDELNIELSSRELIDELNIELSSRVLIKTLDLHSSTGYTEPFLSRSTKESGLSHKINKNEENRQIKT